MSSPPAPDKLPSGEAPPLTTFPLERGAGFEPVVVGALDRAKDFDPGMPVFNKGMSGPELRRRLGVP